MNTLTRPFPDQFQCHDFAPRRVVSWKCIGHKLLRWIVAAMLFGVELRLAAYQRKIERADYTVYARNPIHHST